MARVEISKDLKREILKKFKQESKKVFKLMYSLKENPNKGKKLGQISGIMIKEMKYKNFRFYFIISGYRLRILNLKEINEILIKFLKMSNKKNQQKTIDEIKDFIRKRV